MFTITLDKSAAIPLFQQLVRAIKLKITQNVLRSGDRLPPSRALAQQLEVSRTTVCKAYDELYALGYLESYQGGFSKVIQGIFSILICVSEAQNFRKTICYESDE